MRDEDPEIVKRGIMDQAIGWHVRQAEMDEGDWEDFIAWLEQSPAHSEAYDRIANQDRLLPVPELAAASVPANDDQPSRQRWPYFAGGAVAAAVALALAVPMTQPPSPRPYVVQTRPGQHRTLDLADGSRIELTGGSRLQLDHADPRIATLEAGEALVTVRHDAEHPFTLRSGAITLRDLGTVFDVTRAEQRLDVQVSEGSVLFERGGHAITLGPGDALTVREDARQISRTKVPVQSIGGWRSGTLRFEGEALAVVSAAIRRDFGTEVVLEGDLPQRPFTGMVQLTGAADRDIPHLAALIGVGWRRNGEQWILAPRAAASR